MKKNRFQLHKYKFLIVSIAMFLIFDLGVLGLNIYTSNKIQQQTERIDLAARQRTLSQQLSKATLYIKSQRLSRLPYSAGLDELRDYYLVFDQTQKAFVSGGYTRATESGSSIFVSAVDNPDAKKTLKKTQELWGRFKQYLEPFQEDILITDEEIIPASDFISVKNNELFLLMNDLTIQFKRESDRQTNFLRVAQFVGILLATINFFVILLHFIAQLRNRDQQVERSQNEVNNIMDTVDQGLFLLDKDGIIIGNHSASLVNIFGEKNISGQSLKYFLKKFIGKKDLEVTSGFLGLLFDPSKWVNLLDDLNPLKQIPVRIQSDSMGSIDKYLTFSFLRVSDSSSNSKSFDNVLVTVSDVTEVVLLERKVEALKSQSDIQFKVLNMIAQCPDPEGLKVFLKRSKETFERINCMLKDEKRGSLEHKKRADNIFTLIHTIKGDAASLSLDYFVSHCHHFEEQVKSLLNKKIIKGEYFLGLTVALRELRAERRVLETLSENILNDNSRHFDAVNVQKNISNRFQGMSKFMQEMAERQGKRVEFIQSGFREHELEDEFASDIKSVLVQLLRNAIAHGIEKPEQRMVSGKKSVGLVSASLIKHDSGQYRLIVEDDGKGISRNEIVRVALAKGLIRKADIDTLGKKDLMDLLFLPGFTSSESVDLDKGQGFGMDVVRKLVDKLGGYISIRSSKNSGCRMIVIIPVAQAGIEVEVDKVLKRLA